MDFKEFEKILNSELSENDELKGQCSWILLNNVLNDVKEAVKILLPQKYRLFVSSYNSNIQLSYGSGLSTKILILKVKKKVSSKSDSLNRKYDFKQVSFEPYYDDNGDEIKTFEDFIKYCDRKKEINEIQNNQEIQEFLDCLTANGIDAGYFLDTLDMWERLSYVQKRKIRESNGR